jgi:hypothetical protein
MSGAVAMGDGFTQSLRGAGADDPAIQTAVPQRTPPLPHPFAFEKALNLA